MGAAASPFPKIKWVQSTLTSAVQIEENSVFFEKSVTLPFDEIFLHVCVTEMIEKIRENCQSPMQYYV